MSSTSLYPYALVHLMPPVQQVTSTMHVDLHDRQRWESAWGAIELRLYLKRKTPYTPLPLVLLRRRPSSVDELFHLTATAAYGKF